MLCRLRFRRVRGFDVTPLCLLRCLAGAEGSAFRGVPFVVLCKAPPFANRNCMLLGVAFALVPLATAMPIPFGPSNTVIPFPRPTYCTSWPVVPPAGSKVIGKEKFAGTAAVAG
jgi:hypothetical protein